MEGGTDYTYTQDEYTRNTSHGDSANTDDFADFGGQAGAQASAKPGKNRTYGGAYAYVKAHEAAERRAKAEAMVSAKHFSVGERITHPVFGAGTVLSVKPLSGDVLYEVMFDTVGTKKVMGNYATMTRLK